MSVRFDIDPQPGENQRGCTALVRSVMPPSRRSHVMIAVYVGVIAAAFLLTPADPARPIVIGVGAVLATESLLRWEGNRRVRHARQADPHADESHHIELSDAGVRTWCQHVDARYPWSDFLRASETPEFILLVRAPGAGAAIPKRILAAGQVEELQAALNTWMSGRTSWSSGSRAI